MSEITITSTRTYTEHQCRSCGGFFGMDHKLWERTWGGPNNDAGGYFWCPWCGYRFHGIGESELARAKREAERAEARAMERLEVLERAGPCASVRDLGGHRPMSDHLARLSIEISTTADGKATYVQISTPGVAMPVNVVLVADEVTVLDGRAAAALTGDPSEEADDA